MYGQHLYYLFAVFNFAGVFTLLVEDFGKLSAFDTS